MESPEAGVLLGKLVGREAHGHPELDLVQLTRLEWKLETARHDAEDGVGFAVENNRFADYAGIAVEAVEPQCVADDGERLARVFFLRGKDAAENGLNAERGKNAGCEAG